MGTQVETVDVDTKPKVLLCLSGSVAVLKVPQLAAMLAEFAEVGQVKSIFSNYWDDIRSADSTEEVVLLRMMHSRVGLCTFIPILTCSCSITNNSCCILSLIWLACLMVVTVGIVKRASRSPMPSSS